MTDQLRLQDSNARGQEEEVPVKKVGRVKKRPGQRDPNWEWCCEPPVPRPPPPLTGSGLKSDDTRIECDCTTTNCTISSSNPTCTCATHNYLCSASCPCVQKGNCDNFYHTTDRKKYLASNQHYYKVQLCPLDKCTTCNAAEIRQRREAEICCHCTQNECRIGRQGRFCNCALESRKCGSKCKCESCQNK